MYGKGYGLERLPPAVYDPESNEASLSIEWLGQWARIEIAVTDLIQLAALSWTFPRVLTPLRILEQMAFSNRESEERAKR